MRFSTSFAALALTTALAASLTGCVESSPTYSQAHYTNPTYTIERGEGNVEIRSYRPMLVAEITEHGDRQTAMRSGYQDLNAYFMGANDHNEIIATTQPVVEFPILHGGYAGMRSVDNQAWVVRFVLPVEFTPATVPQPENGAIRILETNPVRVLAITYSGPWSDDNIQNNENMLRTYALNYDLHTTDVPAYAFYDAPTVESWSRHNEVMLKLSDY